MMVLKSLIVAVLLAVAALPVTGQALLDLTRHGNCATGTLGASVTGDPGALFIRCGADPTVFLVGYESRFGYRDRDGMVMGFKTEQTRRAAEDAHSRDLGRFARTLVRFRFDDGDSYAISGRVDRDGFLYTAAANNMPAGDLIRSVVLPALREGRELHLITNGESSGTVALDGAAAAYKDWFSRLQAASPR